MHWPYFLYSKDMQITVFGASGKVGIRVVELALKRGFMVVAFAHSHDPFQGHPRLRVLRGDIYNATEVEKAISGSDAVISCLGSWGTPKKNVLSSAMRAIIPAMQNQNINRLITLTGSGAVEPGKPLKPQQELLLNVLRPFPAGKVFRDGMDHMKLLAESSLSWTTLRSPVMTSFGSQKFHLNLKVGSLVATINRQAVATALLDQLDEETFFRQAPVIHRS
jgi:putative NADH-flavin reductase